MEDSLKTRGFLNAISRLKDVIEGVEIDLRLSKKYSSVEGGQDAFVTITTQKLIAYQHCLSILISEYKKM